MCSVIPGVLEVVHTKIVMGNKGNPIPLVGLIIFSGSKRSLHRCSLAWEIIICAIPISLGNILEFDMYYIFLQK